MDAILILLMPYNDRFQSDRVVQPFLVNDDRQNMKVFRQLVVKSVIVVIQLSFHREAGSYLRNRVLDVLDPGFRIVFFFPFII